MERRDSERLWPLHSFLSLAPLSGAASSARLHARQLLWEWSFTEISDTAELLVAELVTNAMYATQAMERYVPIRFFLLSDKARVVVSVWDCNPHLPVRRDVSEEAESGRGLVLVDALSDAWGWQPHQSLGGKIVWCEITVNAVPAELPGQYPDGGAQ